MSEAKIKGPDFDLALLEEPPRSRRGGAGVTFLGMLGTVFVVLKLTGNVDWSWWVVLSPIWIPNAILFAALGAWVSWILIAHARGR